MTPAALQSKSSTLGPRARGDELGLTAVAFSLFICFHLHLGFAFRPSEHLLAQAVHEVARARRAVRIQRVLLTGSTENIGKLPVLRADGEDFHYQLENPATLPSVASNAPTNPDLMNAAIIYKDTAEGETANELYYKRKHDRESVIITFNDTSPRSFGTDYRSFGWTAHIIPDVAEPTPGNHPYPSVPTHWNAFMRVISISQGTYQW